MRPRRQNPRRQLRRSRGVTPEKPSGWPFSRTAPAAKNRLPHRCPFTLRITWKKPHLRRAHQDAVGQIFTRTRSARKSRRACARGFPLENNKVLRCFTPGTRSGSGRRNPPRRKVRKVSAIRGQPAAVGIEKVVAHGHDVVDGQLRGGMGIEQRRLIDVLLLERARGLDRHNLHVDVGAV